MATSAQAAGDRYGVVEATQRPARRLHECPSDTADTLSRREGVHPERLKQPDQGERREHPAEPVPILLPSAPRPTQHAQASLLVSSAITHTYPSYISDPSWF